MPDEPQTKEPSQKEPGGQHDPEPKPTKGTGEPSETRQKRLGDDERA